MDSFIGLSSRAKRDEFRTAKSGTALAPEQIPQRLFHDLPADL
jgi:hypothetical protein